ncbi:Uncharacterised protein [Sphingobacterium daejeonense]|nr:Uncharacterised protein [Sphingobacterium daejeonense]
MPSITFPYVNRILIPSILSISKKGEDWFMVQGQFDKELIQDAVSCSIKRNQKKTILKRTKKNTEDWQIILDNFHLL